MKSKIQHISSAVSFPNEYFLNVHHVIQFHTSKRCFQFCAVMNTGHLKDIANEYKFDERSIKFGKFSEF